MTAQILGLRYDSPLEFNLRQRLLVGIGAPFLGATVKLLSHSCRHEVLGLEHWEGAQQKRGRAIVALWHESATMAAYHYRNAGVHTLASYSFDAEWAARTLRHLGILSVRGSSSRGGAQALRDLAVALGHDSTVMLTLDGPRGPRRVAKSGAAVLAARTGVPILPHAFAVRPAWRLRSWDRLAIAKPFSRVISVYGPAIAPPRNTSPFAIEETRQQVETSLNAAHQQIEAMLGIEDAGAACSLQASIYTAASSNR